MGILLLLAVRLTWGESVYTMVSANVPAGKADESTPTPGLATIIDCSVLMLLLAAGVAWTQKLARSHLVWLGIVLALAALAVAAQWHAPAKLLALAGTCDLVMALLAGWSVFVLLADARLRPLVVAVLVAVLCVWCFRIYVQRFVDMPENWAYFQENRARIMAENGWKEDGSEIRLYEARLKSEEAGGFLPFSNVFAAGQAGMVLLAAALAFQTFRAAMTQNAQQQNVAGGKGEIPLPYLFASLLAMVTAAGAATVAFSGSKGAGAALALVGTIVLACLFLPRFVATHRRALVAAASVAVIAGFGATLAWGLTHNALPGRSLLFRWHYWVGSAPMIRDHPLLGVGLNNFGGYYGQTKLPYAPEDVKDPHSFFVRIAAEMGLPATVLMLGLLAWAFLRSTRERFAATEEETRFPLAETMIIGAVFCVVWFIIRAALADRVDIPYNAAMNVIYAVLAFGGFALATWALHVVPPALLRPVFLGAGAGAAAILLYDQVNMAAVTGSVAMLFWVLLATAQPQDPAIVSPARPGRWVSPLLAVAGIGLPATTSIKLAAGTHPWDTDRMQRQMGDAIGGGNLGAAESLVDEALAANARSGSLLMMRIHIRLERHEPVAAYIRATLALQPSNPNLRLALVRMVADGPADWPVSERIAALEQAIELDKGLAWLEGKSTTRDIQRFSDKQLAEIRQLLERLRAAEKSNPPQ